RLSRDFLLWLAPSRWRRREGSKVSPANRCRALQQRPRLRGWRTLMTTPTNEAAHVDERLGLLGRKVGMMRVFTDDGDAVPVTVLDVSNNRVTQVKTAATSGYSTLQVAFGTRKASRVSKPEAGHLAKAGVEAGELLKEFRVDADVDGHYPPGAPLPVTLFAAGQTVDVQGTSIGKGFAGTIKRHNFGSQR